MFSKRADNGITRGGSKCAAALLLALLLALSLCACGNAGTAGNALADVNHFDAGAEEDAGQSGGAAADVSSDADVQPDADAVSTDERTGSDSSAEDVPAGKPAGSENTGQQTSGSQLSGRQTSGTQSAGQQTSGNAADSGTSGEDTSPVAEEHVSRVTLSIVCGAALDNIGDLKEEKLSVVPADGIMLAPTAVTIEDGDTVYDVLVRAAADAGIALDEKNSLGSVYIRGIGGLYEFDCGRRSGWMYDVNGTPPNYGCSKVGVKDGDVIEWYYVCR